MPSDTHDTFSSAKNVPSSAAVEKALTRRRVDPDKVKTSEEEDEVEKEDIVENCLMGSINLGAEEEKDVNLTKFSNEIDDFISIGADDAEYNIVSTLKIFNLLLLLSSGVYELATIK